MNIYVGNFSFDMSSEELQAVFEAYGQVDQVKIIKDKVSGESRGFGFVEMPNKNEAQAAMDGITEIKGRRITINEARPQTNNNFGPSKSGGSFRKPDTRRRESRY